MAIRETIARYLLGDAYERALTPAQIFGKGLDDWYAGTSAAGVRVTTERVMEAAVGACVRLLADDISSLPVDVFRRRGRTTEPLSTPDWLVSPSGRPFDTVVSYLSDNVVSLGSDGNIFVLVQPSVFDVQALTVLDPNTVTVFEQDGARFWRINDGRVFGESNIIHIPWVRLPGALRGMSVVSSSRESVGLEIAAEQWASRFFANGATVGGVIEIPREAGNLSADQREALRQQFAMRHTGRNSWNFGILEGGAHLNTSAISPQQAELEPLWRHVLESAARIFHIPPHLLASQDPGAAARASVEERGIGYVRHAVRNFTSRIEAPHNVLLRSWYEDPDVFMKINLNALMRGDARGRAEYYEKMLSSKTMTREEVRELEDLPYIGDLGFLETPNNNAPEPAAAADDARSSPPWSIMSIDEPDVTVNNAPSVHVDSVTLGDQAVDALADSATKGISAGVVVIGRKMDENDGRIIEQVTAFESAIVGQLGEQAERQAQIEATVQALAERERQRDLPIERETVQTDEVGRPLVIRFTQGDRVTYRTVERDGSNIARVRETVGQREATG